VHVVFSEETGWRHRQKYIEETNWIYRNVNRIEEQ
jgi:hypothetical protein